MNKSESITDLAAALCLAQAEMGGATKNSTNPHFKSSFADLESVIKVIKPAFFKHGLSFIQLPITSEGGKGIGVSTMLMHSSGQWIEGEYLLPLEKVTPQGAGAAITYARRYSLVSLVGIPQVDLDAEDISVQESEVSNTHNMRLEGVSGAPASEPKKRVDKELAQKAVAAIAEAYIDEDDEGLFVHWDKLKVHEKEFVWRSFNSKQQAKIKEINFKHKGKKS